MKKQILNKDFIYSRLFMTKVQSLDISKNCPVEIANLNIIIENKQIEVPNGGNKDKTTKTWIRGTNFNSQVKRTENTWINKTPPDVKRMTAILNKLSEDNYDKLVEETKTFNYTDPEVVSIIFKKTLAEPFFSEIYARFCKSLVNLHDLIRELCIIEFSKNKHKDLGKFIGELYKLDLIMDLNSFINVLLKDINDSNLEILCKIITTIGSSNPMFEEIIGYLNEIKNIFSSRHKFMIMDIIEHRI